MFTKFFKDIKNEFSGYNASTLSKDLMAGLTVAAVALPLALAFGVSSGADAASGLITAIIAGIVIGGLSGASYQISGPTGAMSAILLTLSATHGIEGVLMAGLLSGVILLIAALIKAGKLVSYIPAPVITGFTSGIAIIIALGQIDNFFGTISTGENTILKILSYAEHGFSPDLWTVLFGLIVIAIMVFYPKKLNSIFPSSLASIIIVLVINMVINPDKAIVAEVGSIPKSFITDSALIKNGLDFSNISSLIMPAISIAALGMIESLLCGASAGKMKGEKMDSQRELIAQGIGNIIIPLFGGVPATAAIARTSVAIKAGGRTRLVSVFHSATLILSMFLLGSVMSRIPLSALAGVLIVTAWRMNDWDDIKTIFKNKFKSSIAQFLITMIATVIFDLTVAIVCGVVLSMLLFIIKSSDLTINVSDVDTSKTAEKGIIGSYKHTKLIYLSGPMFFGTQGKLADTVNQFDDSVMDVIFSMRGVPTIDTSGIDEFEEIYNQLNKNGVNVIFCGISPGVMKMMERSGFVNKIGVDAFVWDAVEAIRIIEKRVFLDTNE